MRTRTLFLSVAGVLVLAAVSATVVFNFAMNYTLITDSAALFDEQVVKAAHDKGVFVDKASISPLISRLFGFFAPLETYDTFNLIVVLNWLSLAVLAVLLYLVMVRAGFRRWAAGTSLLLWICQPVLCGQAANATPGFVAMLFLLGPSLILALVAASRPVVRFVGVGCSGIWAGLAMFVHPLALWIAPALWILLFTSRAAERRRPGLVHLAPLGLDFVLMVLGTAVGLAVAMEVLDAGLPSARDYWFGFLEGPHPALAVLGTSWQGGELGGPPWYTVWLWLMVRTPPLLLIPAVAGMVLVVASSVRRAWPSSQLSNVRLVLPFAGTLAVLALCCSLLGSPLWPAWLNLQVPVSLGLAVLAAYALHHAWGWWADSNSRENGSAAGCGSGVIIANTQNGVPDLPSEQVMSAGDGSDLKGYSDSGARRRLSVVVGAVLAILTPIAGVGLSAYSTRCSLPLPQAYVNLVGGGTGAFLDGGNDPVAEPVFPLELLHSLDEMKVRELAVYPWGKKAERALAWFSRLEGAKKIKVRDGGPSASLLVRWSGSPRFMDARLLLNQFQTADAVTRVGGADYWSVYPR